MSIRVKIAQTPAELDAVYRLRHRVFAEEEERFAARPDGRVVDRFDRLATTANLMATDACSVVGAVRLTEPSSAGLPTDGWWDFGPHLPADAAGVGAGSMLCVQRSHRECPWLFIGLLGMAQIWLTSRGVTHVVGVFNPDIEQICTWAGGRRVAEPFLHEGLGVPVLPMVIDLGDLATRFTTFVERQYVDHFLQSFEREFASKGEALIHEGDATDTVYVIIDGRVAVSRRGPEGSGEEWVEAELRGGDIVGELAPLTGGLRTADVVALTDVELMVIERESLLRQLGDATTARALLEIVAARLAASRAALLGVLPDPETGQAAIQPQRSA